MNETELIESLSKDVERYCAAAEDTLKYAYEMRNACEKLMDETDSEKNRRGDWQNLFVFYVLRKCRRCDLYRGVRLCKGTFDKA